MLVSAWFHPGFAAAAPLSISACATTGDGAPSVADVQSVINEALGTKTAVNDFNNDGAVNVVDIQTVIDAVLGLGCFATPVITDFNPKTGSIGTLVTVTGRYLVATQISLPRLGGGTANQLPLTISAAGVSFAVPTTAATGPVTITTASGSATTAASFTVTPIPANQTVLTGRALTAGGSPVAGAVVTTQDGLSTTTTSDGRFLIAGESASISELLVTAKGTANGVAIGASVLVSPQGGALTDAGDIQLLACAPPPTGLVSWWTGDGHLEDIVSGNNGIVQISSPGYAPGLIGQAFNFDGLSQFFSVPDSSTLDAIDTAISAAAWINPQNTTAIGVMLSRNTLGNAEVFTVYLNYPGNGAVDVRVSDTVHGARDFYTSPGVLQAGQWQHLAATANTSTGTVKLYLNGLPVSLTNPGTLSGQLPAASSLFIGALQPSYYIYKGLMEELELYGVEVTQTQVLAMISAPAGTCSAPFTTTATGRVVDQTGSGVAGAAVSTMGPAGTVRSATSASDGTFSISGVVAVAPIVAGASKTVGSVPLFGTSGSIAPVQGGTTSLGNIVLAACSTPVTGLVSWWTGDGHLDDIVSGNNGTVQITNPTFVPGKVGEAFSFNGANQFFSVPDSAGLDGITSAITVSGWINPQTANSYETIFSRRTSGGVETLTIYLNLPNPGSVDVRVSDTDHGTQDFYSSPGVIQFGQWQHLAATANVTSGTVKLYINGQQVGLTIPVTLSGQLHAADSLFIGALQPGYYNYNGLIDELQLYGVELTQVQIQTIMAEPAGSCSAPFTTVVTGRVVNQSGAGVAGVVVTTFGPSGTIQSATTASDGTFSISGVLAVMGPVSVGATGTVSGVSMFGTSAGVSPVEGGTVSVGNVVLAPCVTPAPGLVSWWTGDGNLDDIVSGNNGVLQSTSPSFAVGQVGQAFSFDGVSEYIGITDSASLDGITSAISVSGWINPQTASTYEAILSRRASGGGEVFTIYLNYPNSGSVDVRVTDTVHGTQDFYSSPGLVQFGQWQHFAATANLSTGTVQLYWNGQQIGLTIPVTLSGQFPAGSNLYIGAYQPQYYIYKGLIDELQLYSVELTQTQVQDLYFAPSAGVCRAGFETGVTGLVQDANSKPVAGARATAAGGAFSLTASDGTFTIPNVLAIFSPIRVDAAAIVNGTPVFGNSANVTAVAAGATNVGNISLSQCSPGGLVSLWPGEGNANDIVGGNNGTFHGSAYAPGIAGQAFSFDGSTAYISVPDSASLDAITSAITVAGWVNPQSATYTEAIFSRNVPPDAFTIYFNVYGSGSVDVNVTDSVHGTEGFYSSAGVVQFGQWQYLAVTANTVTGLVKLYLNGQQVGLTAPVVLSGQFPAAHNWFIGGAQAGTYLYLGLIDELQLYNGELSQAQIQNIYGQGGAGMCRK